MNQGVELTISLANTHLDGCRPVYRLVDASDFETGDLGDNPTMIIDRPRTGLAHDRSKIPHLGAEHRRWRNGIGLCYHEFHTVDGNDINSHCLDIVDPTSKRACVFRLSHEVQVVDTRPQSPYQRRTRHSIVSGVEHAMSVAGDTFRSHTIGGRDKTPGNAEGIIDDQFRAEMASNQ